MNVRHKNYFKKNSKSFYFASLFLSQQSSKHVYILYQFCRRVDDLVDKGKKNNFKKLYLLEKELKRKSFANDSYLNNISLLIKSKIIRIENLLELLKGVSLDTKKVHFQKKEQLLNYSYLVAGTVGMMMCGILKTTNNYSYKYAVDLGIAMQLTNILRDILEDAKMNRVYIPKSWVLLKPDNIINQNKNDRKKIIFASNKIFLLSEKYYSSALDGLGFLPLRSRFTVLTALVVYRSIGLKIIKKKYSNLYKREVISNLEKVFCLIEVIFIFFTKRRIHKKKYNHDSTLHFFINNEFLLKKLKYE